MREGFTTGSAAAAAAAAAVELLLSGRTPERVAVPLPPFRDGPPGRIPERFNFEKIEQLRADFLENPRRETVARRTCFAVASAAGESSSLTDESGRDVSAVVPSHGPTDESGNDKQLFQSGNFLDIPVAGARRLPDGAAASVIKDGGDDPDATHRAVIETCARFDAALSPGELRIEGGRGVGRVTLPGLPVPVGEAAVNPVPREQIRRAALEALARFGGAAPDRGLLLTVSVPDGENIARRTLNPRLGILGGISILGTHGTVRPYSHEAWQSVILQSMDVARAALPPGAPGKGPALCLSTGRRSERLLMARYPALPPLLFIQAADHAAFSLRAASRRAFTPLAWGCFFGKMAKLAQGMENTHARNQLPDMGFIAGGLAGRSQESERLKEKITACSTAAHALELLLGAPEGRATVARLTALAKRRAQSFAGGPVVVHLFHPDGRELAAA
jgi:cobalt-precorrin-5B (C1)-methyltransferase